MRGLSLPLKISKGKFERMPDTVKSVRAFLHFLISTPKHSFAADPEFGFILGNLKFENVSEGEVMYGRKISGTSANAETFAYELKSAINAYEKRLSDVRVTMTYVRQEKLIHITVKAKLVEDDSDFLFTTNMKVWN